MVESGEWWRVESGGGWRMVEGGGRWRVVAGGEWWWVESGGGWRVERGGGWRGVVGGEWWWVESGAVVGLAMNVGTKGFMIWQWHSLWSKGGKRKRHCCTCDFFAGQSLALEYMTTESSWRTIVFAARAGEVGRGGGRKTDLAILRSSYGFHQEISGPGQVDTR